LRRSPHRPAPPATASSTLSVSICRPIRQRAAPSERRTAISCARPAARASIRLARLTHAISSIAVTAPSSTYNIGRAVDTSVSNSGRTVAPLPLLVLGYSCSSWRAMPLISAVAASTVTPLRRRPIAARLE